jgi:hypothetical protein
MRNGLILLAVALAAGAAPASAQISNEQAVRTCRNEVRQNAARRFGTSDIQFRSSNVSNSAGYRDRVEGMFALPRGDREELHRFTCAVNFSNGDLRWVQVDPQVAREPRDFDRENSADRSVLSDDEALAVCRDAVRGRIASLGYHGIDFTTARVAGNGYNERVSGGAKADRGDFTTVFDFSCRLDPNTGSLRSVDVNSR